MMQKLAGAKVEEREKHTVPAGLQIPKKGGQNLDETKLDSEFQDGSTYKIDFGGDKTAEQNVSLKEMLPTGISFVKITGADGKGSKRLGEHRIAKGNDFRYYKVEKGFEKLMGKCFSFTKLHY